MTKLKINRPSLLTIFFNVFCLFAILNAITILDGKAQDSGLGGIPTPPPTLDPFQISGQLNQQLGQPTVQPQNPGDIGAKGLFINEISQKAREKGVVRVIVGVNIPQLFLDGTPDKTEEVKKAINDHQMRIMKALDGYHVFASTTFSFIPFMALSVDTDALSVLLLSPDITTIVEDKFSTIDLANSIPQIKADVAWTMGFSGAGQTIAILDTGVAKNHVFLTGKVVSEACFSGAGGGGGTSFCPGGAFQSTEPDSGLNCPMENAGCYHGTHVAGIAAGKGTDFSGVAKDANIIAIQVFTNEGGIGAYDSDIILGMERVYALRNDFHIAAVNMSFGGGRYYSNCDSSVTAIKAAVENLRAVGIAVVAASGNTRYSDSLSSPACISSAISVGAVNQSDNVTPFSNSASFLSLLAPGVTINSSVPEDRFRTLSGTSMSAPFVSGAWAVLKSKAPDANVDTIFAALAESGVPVTDQRNSITKPRIQLDAALNLLPATGPIITPTIAITILPPSPEPTQLPPFPTSTVPFWPVPTATLAPTIIPPATQYPQPTQVVITQTVIAPTIPAPELTATPIAEGVLAAPVIVAPSGRINTSKPIFEWNPVVGADYYSLAVYSISPGRIMFLQTIDQAAACTNEICRADTSVIYQPDRYEFEVRPGNSKGWSPNSSWKEFVVTN